MVQIVDHNHILTGAAGRKKLFPVQATTCWLNSDQMMLWKELNFLHPKELDFLHPYIIGHNSYITYVYDKNL